MWPAVGTQRIAVLLSCCCCCFALIPDKEEGGGTISVPGTGLLRSAILRLQKSTSASCCTSYRLLLEGRVLALGDFSNSFMRANDCCTEATTEAADAATADMACRAASFSRCMFK